MNAPMTDAELAKHLNLPEGHVAVMDPNKKAIAKVMIRKADELNRWQRGEGPKPHGVLVCERKRR